MANVAFLPHGLGATAPQGGSPKGTAFAYDLEYESTVVAVAAVVDRNSELVLGSVHLLENEALDPAVVVEVNGAIVVVEVVVVIVIVLAIGVVAAVAASTARRGIAAGVVKVGVVVVVVVAVAAATVGRRIVVDVKTRIGIVADPDPKMGCRREGPEYNLGQRSHLDVVLSLP